MSGDKRGAELFFQVISKRYEAASLIITANIAYADLPRIFAGDTTLTSALLKVGCCTMRKSL